MVPLPCRSTLALIRTTKHPPKTAHYVDMYMQVLFCTIRAVLSLLLALLHSTVQFPVGSVSRHSFIIQITQERDVVLHVKSPHNRHTNYRVLLSLYMDKLKLFSGRSLVWDHKITRYVYIHTLDKCFSWRLLNYCLECARRDV